MRNRLHWTPQVLKCSPAPSPAGHQRRWQRDNTCRWQTGSFTSLVQSPAVRSGQRWFTLHCCGAPYSTHIEFGAGFLYSAVTVIVVFDFISLSYLFYFILFYFPNIVPPLFAICFCGSWRRRRPNCSSVATTTGNSSRLTSTGRCHRPDTKRTSNQASSTSSLVAVTYPQCQPPSPSLQSITHSIDTIKNSLVLVVLVGTTILHLGLAIVYTIASPAIS